MEKDNVMVGSIRYEHGIFYIKFGYGTVDETEQAKFFKDELAYKNNMDAPCYAPECYFDDEDEVSDSFYTHRRLLKMCGYNEELCDTCFDILCWQSPEVCIEDLEPYDFAHYWGWLKVGGKAFWGLNEWWDADFYEVVKIEDDPEDWNPYTVVWLRKEDECNPGEYEETEAYLWDLAKTDIQITINKQ